MVAQKQYNYCLDWIKGIACIFVVFMHCEFPGMLGVAVQAISRFCVPFFFMVSGYYCYKNSPVSMSERKRKVLHILKITIYASLFYILFSLIQNWIWGDVSLSVRKKDVIAFVLFNHMKVIVSQMWFLWALLYVYVLYLWIGGQAWYKRYSMPIVVACFALYVVLAQGLHIAGISVPNFVYKNWFIEGLGFFTLGYILHQYQDRIKIQNNALLALVFVFTILSLVERYLLGRDFGVNICSVPQVVSLFLYGINNPTRHEGMLQKLGKTCSIFVYILHPFVWHSLERVYSAMHIENNTIALYMMPLLVLGITILLSIICNNVNTSQKKQIVRYA